MIFSGRRLTGPPSEAPESFSSLRAATYANVLPSSCPLKLEHFSVLFEIWCILIYLIFTTHPRCNTFGHFFFFYLFHCRRWATGSERPAKNNKRRRTSDPSNRRLTVVSSSPPVDLQPAHRLRSDILRQRTFLEPFFFFSWTIDWNETNTSDRKSNGFVIVVLLFAHSSPWASSRQRCPPHPSNKRKGAAVQRSNFRL